MDPDRHPERHESGRGSQPGKAPQLAPHAEGGSAGTGSVVLLVEQQQDRVSAPLDDAPAELIGHGQEVGEAQVEDVAGFLRADPTLSGQPFAHLGEAGEVDEREGAHDRAVAVLRGLPEPVHHQARDVRAKNLGRHGG